MDPESATPVEPPKGPATLAKGTKVRLIETAYHVATSHGLISAMVIE